MAPRFLVEGYAERAGVGGTGKLVFTSGWWPCWEIEAVSAEEAVYWYAKANSCLAAVQLRYRDPPPLNYAMRCDYLDEEGTPNEVGVFVATHGGLVYKQKPDGSWDETQLPIDFP